jgi:hypothetical protein
VGERDRPSLPDETTDPLDHLLAHDDSVEVSLT